MGDPKAFLNIPRQEAGYRPISERITDYSQVEQTLNTNSRKLQVSGIYRTYMPCPLRKVLCAETILRPAGDDSRE